MSRSHRIEYLRWARAQAEPPWATYNLILSGMTAPEASELEMPEAEELLGFLHRDHPALAEAIAPVLSLPPTRVLVQPGTHYAIALMLTARLESRPGPVVVEAPAYEPLRRIPESLGAPVLRLPRCREDGYRLDLEALDSLAAAAPSVLLLSHPHNPSGACLDDEEIGALARFAARTGCSILSDEVYLEFLDEGESRSLLHRIEGTVILRSFTKVFGLGGLRCSVIAGDRVWIEAAIAFTDHGPATLPAPSHAVAMRVWERREKLWRRARDVAATGRAVVSEWLDGVEDLMESPLFPSGIICFPRLRARAHEAALARCENDPSSFGFGLDDLRGSSHRWIADLRRREDVQLTPGLSSRRPVRFGWASGWTQDSCGAGSKESSTTCGRRWSNHE